MFYKREKIGAAKRHLVPSDNCSESIASLLISACSLAVAVSGLSSSVHHSSGPQRQTFAATVKSVLHDCGEPAFHPVQDVVNAADTEAKYCLAVCDTTSNANHVVASPALEPLQGPAFKFGNHVVFKADEFDQLVTGAAPGQSEVTAEPLETQSKVQVHFWPSVKCTAHLMKSR